MFAKPSMASQAEIVAEYAFPILTGKKSKYLETFQFSGSERHNWPNVTSEVIPRSSDHEKAPSHPSNRPKSCCDTFSRFGNSTFSSPRINKWARVSSTTSKNDLVMYKSFDVFDHGVQSKGPKYRDMSELIGFRVFNRSQRASLLSSLFGEESESKQIDFEFLIFDCISQKSVHRKSDS